MKQKNTPTPPEPVPPLEEELVIPPTLDAALIAALIKTDITSKGQVEVLIKSSHGEQQSFEALLLREGFMTDEQLGQLSASVHGWRYINLTNESVDEALAETISEEFARSAMVMPFRDSRDEVIRVAMARPDDVSAKRILRKHYGPDTAFYYATTAGIRSAHTQFDKDFTEKTSQLLAKHATASAARDLDDPSIVNFVDNLLLHGIRRNASDIHIEPTAHDSVVRERVDGVLHKTVTFQKDIHQLITLRIKVLAHLATDEHAEPQDGKLLYDTPEGKRADIRVSIVPTTHGEKIVMRLLVSQENAFTLDQLGMIGDDLASLEKALSRSWGMILATGPTGAGKTTTLYATLRKINDDDVNISTIEDPAEYDLPGTNQIQVNEKVGLTFARGLRSIVRQDPDVILVGEIRDAETAGIAINSAMTGHLVLSTLHTNDAATTIPRLTDMGVEPFLIASTVDTIIAQRLLRTICVRCRQSEEVKIADLKDALPPDVLKKLGNRKKTARVYTGKGCKVCGQSGYKGRIGVYEVLRVNDDIRALIMKNADADAIAKAAKKNGMNTMLDDAIEKVREGVTTIDELLRVLHTQ